jgi:hypothetical protein
MKKHILLLFFAIIFYSFPGFSQLGVGLRGGYGGSSTSQETVNGMTRTLGMAPTFGLSILYDLDLHFSAALEFNYFSFAESFKYGPEFSRETQSVKTGIKVNYLQIPILGRVTFGDKKFKTFMSFGPYIGIGLDGTWENYPIKAGSGDIRFEDIEAKARFQEGDFNRVDLGGIIGLGGQYKIGTSGAIFFEGRFQLGFFNVYNTFPKELNDAYSISKYQKPAGSWRTANITVGYFHTFKLPKKKSSNTVKKAGKQKR